MEILTLLPMMYQGAERIFIRHSGRKEIDDLVKRVRGAKWSSVYGAWHLPLSKASYEVLLERVGSLAKLNSDHLSAYLRKRQAVNASAVPDLVEADSRIEKEEPIPLPIPVEPAPTVAYHLSFENLKLLERVIDQLSLKACSRNTVRTYRGELLVYFQVLGKVSAERLQTADVKRYLLKCIKDGISENGMHSRINALKFLYEQVLRQEKFFLDIPRPKKRLQLPKVLGEQEITRLFNALGNKKHKAILFTAYSAGLRVSEVVSLRLKDIDSDRMQIFVEKAKGKKDRYVSLSPVLLDILREYVKLWRPPPQVYLFEGHGAPGSMYSARSCQKIFQLARQRAGIRKDVSFHSLRHSFATHVLEKGMDIRYIKDILGHFNIKTTERYLHVRKEQLVNIVSPLDDIWKKGGLKW
jgi:integrase/recombinase XerD